MTKYIIKNATVVSVDEAIGNVSNCDVVIEDEFIKAVGENLEHSTEHIVIDGTNSIVSPGFVDTHRHTWQTQLRSVTTDYVLTDYFMGLRVTYGSSYKVHDAYIGNYCGALESIDNGITCLIDHSHIMNSPDHADAAIKGLRDAKIRGTFCYAAYPNPVWDGSCMDKEREEKTPEWRLEDVKRVRKTHFPSNEPTDLLRFGFAPSEPVMTAPDQLAKEIELARSLGAAIITAHIGIGRYDPLRGEVRELGKRNLLGPDMVFSHCSALADDELEAVKQNDVKLSSTPDTELQMAMGHPIAFKAKDLGCTASIGVDICSNNPADMFQQMRLLLQTQRHFDHYKSSGPPLAIARKCSEVLEMATMGGAKAMGLEKIVGSVSPGKRADLLITRCDSTRLVPVIDPVGALVLYANGSDVETVFINGEIVKSGGKLVDVDWPKVRQELRESASSVLETSKRIPTAFVQATREALLGTLPKS